MPVGRTRNHPLRVGFLQREYREIWIRLGGVLHLGFGYGESALLARQFFPVVLGGASERVAEEQIAGVRIFARGIEYANVPHSPPSLCSPADLAQESQLAGVVCGEKSYQLRIGIG